MSECVCVCVCVREREREREREKDATLCKNLRVIAFRRGYVSVSEHSTKIGVLI